MGLSVFEFAIGATLCGLGRTAIAKLRHADALDAGQQVMKYLRRKPKKGKTSARLFARIGARKYAAAKAEWNWPTQGGITIEVSRRELFRLANLPRTSPNLDRLPQVLKRLAQQTSRDLPPVLLSYSSRPGDKLRLEIDVRWVPNGRYDLLPWPLPTNGPIVLALYLFAFGIDRRPESRTSIKFSNLYRLLGISARHARRALDRALTSVNEHLKELNANGALDKAHLATMFAIMPSRYGTYLHLTPVGGTHGAAAPESAEADIDRGAQEVLSNLEQTPDETLRWGPARSARTDGDDNDAINYDLMDDDDIPEHALRRRRRARTDGDEDEIIHDPFADAGIYPRSQQAQEEAESDRSAYPNTKMKTGRRA